MKNSLLVTAIVCASLFASAMGSAAADPPGKEKLDVLNMREIPPGYYEVQLELSGKPQTAKISIQKNQAFFVKSTAIKLEGLSGKFELIGNGVYFAQLKSSQNYLASQWWIFHPDGTATIKEIPDRGENESAKPMSEKPG